MTLRQAAFEDPKSKVLVHCALGVNRSVPWLRVVVSYRFLKGGKGRLALWEKGVYIVKNKAFHDK